MPLDRAAAARRLFLLAAIGSFTAPPLANVAAGLGLLAWALAPGALDRTRALAATPAARAVALFLGVMAVAMLWADAPWGRRLGEWWSWRPLLLVLVGSTLFDTPAARLRFARALVAVLALAALVSFVLFLAPAWVLLDERGIILRNHVTQGMAWLAGLALCACLWRAAAGRERWLVGAAALLILANLALVATGRSPHVALLVMAAWIAPALVPQRPRMAAVVALALTAALLGSSGMVRQGFGKVAGEMDTVMSSPVETSTGLRLIIWGTTRDILLAHPVLGVGVGGFAPAYARLIHERYSGWQASEAKDTHNQYLRVAVEAGIPGVLAFVILVFTLLRTAPAGLHGQVGTGLLLAWLVTSLFNSHLQTFGEAHLLGVVLGVLRGVPGSTLPGVTLQSRSSDSTAV
jgi:O-antigen ligase